MNWQLKRLKDNENLKVFSLFFCVFSTLLFLSYCYIKITREGGGLKASEPFISSKFRNEAIDTESSSSYNFLLLGYGGPGHDGSSLSDVLIVVHFNLESKRIVLISIPRDLWTEMPVRSDIKENHKINEAYAIGIDDRLYPLKEPIYGGEAGGGEMAKKVVSNVIGMPVNYFVAIDFNGFKNMIDILGGVRVDVPTAFDDHFYPVKGLENEPCGKSGKEIAKLTETLSGFELEKQFECRYEHLHFEKGPQVMDGETALKFVRSRHSSQHGGDFARSQRQFALLVGIKDKLISTYGISKLDELYNQFGKIVKTDLSLDLVKSFINVIGNPSSYQLSFVNLTEDNILRSSRNSIGQFILVPKEGVGRWESIHQFIEKEIAN
jgi:anionic cell wall polymer biosynthesis LytR-Cps2A-Psr (LCP) family protein